MSFDTIVSEIGNFPLKGEFETTAEYLNRARTSGLARGYIVEQDLIRSSRDRPLVSYNADTAELLINQYALHNYPFLAREAIAAAHVRLRNPTGPLREVTAVISQHDEVLGSYTAVTGTGASLNILRKRRDTKGIFERVFPDEGGYSGLLPERPRSKPAFQIPSSLESIGITFRIPLERERARLAMPALRGAFVIETREPFLAQAVHRPFVISRNNPNDIEEHATIIFADIQCALVLDGEGQVLLTITTN